MVVVVAALGLEMAGDSMEAVGLGAMAGARVAWMAEQVRNNQNSHMIGARAGGNGGDHTDRHTWSRRLYHMGGCRPLVRCCAVGRTTTQAWRRYSCICPDRGVGFAKAQISGYLITSVCGQSDSFLLLTGM